jgi:hypothetical protein
MRALSNTSRCQVRPDTYQQRNTTKRTARLNALRHLPERQLSSLDCCGPRGSRHESRFREAGTAHWHWHWHLGACWGSLKHSHLHASPSPKVPPSLSYSIRTLDETLQKKARPVAVAIDNRQNARQGDTNTAQQPLATRCPSTLLASSPSIKVAARVTPQTRQTWPDVWQSQLRRHSLFPRRPSFLLPRQVESGTAEM